MSGPPRPQRQIHPHHEILPEEFQTTDQGREAARQAAVEEKSTLTTMSAKLALTDLLPLPNSSLKIPRLGFGIYQSHSQTAVKSCLHALRTGYRHIDSAQFYGNEVEMGEAMRQSGLKRSEVFLATKILSAGGSPEATYKKCIESVDKVAGGREGGYVDLFLIHTPSGGPAARKEMWQALERLVDEGRAKSIGVSNFGVGHIQEMKQWAKIWPPQVNQIELHPWCQQRTTTAFCTSHNIIIEAYSPLVRNQKAHDQTLLSVSKAHGKSTAQVLVRYCLQKGWVPLPKSDTPSRIEENADVYGFELGKEEMDRLDRLDEGEAGAIVQAVKN